MIRASRSTRIFRSEVFDREIEKDQAEAADAAAGAESFLKPGDVRQFLYQVTFFHTDASPSSLPP
eukprot:754428-Hanusia_phi.AAC.2